MNKAVDAPERFVINARRVGNRDYELPGKTFWSKIARRLQSLEEGLGMLLDRDDWYDIAHDLDWSLSYVAQEDAFPDVWSGSSNIPHEAWRAWEEPYRVSYRDYVAVQREKEAGVAGVRDTLKRARIYQKLHPSVAAVSHLHMGATCMVEQMAVMMLGRSARFAPSPRWRNISVFGMLDEIRHAQLDLLFSHDLLKYESRFDWCQKAFHSNEWGNHRDSQFLRRLASERKLRRFCDSRAPYLRARIHQHAIRRACCGRNESGRRRVLEPVVEHSDRRGAPRATRLSNSGSSHEARSGARPASARRKFLEVVPAVPGNDRALDGLLHAARTTAPCHSKSSCWNGWSTTTSERCATMDSRGLGTGTPSCNLSNTATTLCIWGCGSGDPRCFGSRAPVFRKRSGAGSTTSIRPGKTAGECSGTRSSKTSTTARWRKHYRTRYRRSAI